MTETNLNVVGNPFVGGVDGKNEWTVTDRYLDKTVDESQIFAYGLINERKEKVIVSKELFSVLKKEENVVFFHSDIVRDITGNKFGEETLKNIEYESKKSFHVWADYRYSDFAVNAILIQLKDSKAIKRCIDTDSIYDDKPSKYPMMDTASFLLLTKDEQEIIVGKTVYNRLIEIGHIEDVDFAYLEDNTEIFHFNDIEFKALNLRLLQATEIMMDDFLKEKSEKGDDSMDAMNDEGWGVKLEEVLNAEFPTELFDEENESELIIPARYNLVNTQGEPLIGAILISSDDNKYSFLATDELHDRLEKDGYLINYVDDYPTVDVGFEFGNRVLTSITNNTISYLKVTGEYDDSIKIIDELRDSVIKSKFVEEYGIEYSIDELGYSNTCYALSHKDSYVYLSEVVVNNLLELNFINIGDFDETTVREAILPFNDIEFRTLNLILLDYTNNLLTKLGKLKNHLKLNISNEAPDENKRPTWEEYFMANASLIATRSTCDRLHVGAVLVKDNHIVAEGYNGSIAGQEHCDNDNHLMYENGCKRTIHAEMNVITMCAKLGISTKGTTIYVTHQPCPECTKHLNQAGIKEIVYKEPYTHRYENTFDDGMNVRQFKGRNIKISWEE